MSKNYKNPTVITWESLRQLLSQFADRMQMLDSMIEHQGEDIKSEDVYNEIQYIKKELDQIQKGLNIH